MKEKQLTLLLTSRSAGFQDGEPSPSGPSRLQPPTCRTTEHVRVNYTTKFGTESCLIARIQRGIRRYSVPRGVVYRITRERLGVACQSGSRARMAQAGSAGYGNDVSTPCIPCKDVV